MYQKLQSIGIREHLPSQLQAAFEQMCAVERAMHEDRDIVTSTSSHAAFAFIRIRPIRLEHPSLLFAETVPTRQIQEISICRAVWSEGTQEWLPDDARPIFVAHMSSVHFSDAVMGSDMRTLPMTFMELNGTALAQTHEALTVDFLMDWAARQSGEISRITNCVDNIQHFKTMLNNNPDMTEMKRALSGLGVDYLIQNEPSSFARNMMHEVMGKVGKHLRSEIINEVCRSTVTPQPSSNQLSALPHHDSDAVRYQSTDIVRMRSFYTMYVEPDNLRAQLEILDWVGHAMDSDPILSESINLAEFKAFYNAVKSKLEQITSRVTKPGPLGETYYLKPAWSGGGIEISKSVSGRFDFFGAHHDFDHAVEMSFGFAFAEVDSCGSLKVRRPYTPNIRLSMTSSQFVELLQSSQLGSWTKCTLLRSGIHTVPFPKTKQAMADGRLSSGPVASYPEREQLQLLMETLRQLLMKKPLNQARIDDIQATLDTLRVTLLNYQEKLQSTLTSNKTDVVEEHRVRIQKDLTELLRLSDQLSLSAPERIQAALSVLSEKTQNN